MPALTYSTLGTWNWIEDYREAGLKKQQIDIIDSDMPRREKEEAFKELDAARKELYASFNQLFNEVK
jgi:hypothetical protein